MPAPANDPAPEPDAATAVATPAEQIPPTEPVTAEPMAAEPMADEPVGIAATGPDLPLYGLYFLTALALVSWLMVAWPIPAVADPGRLHDGMPTSAALVILFLLVSLSLSLTSTAAFGWWGRTRNLVVLAVGWMAVGLTIVGMSFGIAFMLLLA